jgi:hypothetical protein
MRSVILHAEEGDPSTYCTLINAAVALPLIFVLSIAYERKTQGWGWISRDSRQMYSDAAKAIVTGAGIGVAILLNALTKTPRDIVSTAKWGIYTLLICIVGSIIGLVALSRTYERAVSRQLQKGIQGDQGELTGAELAVILVAACLALQGFFLGFVFIGRLAYKM